MSSQQDPDARVLSYHDVLLRRADLDLLKGPEWLNDQLIHFYFTYILEELHPGLCSRVCLMPPGTTFLLLNSDPSDAAMIFEALQLHEKDLVVFAVNDNPDVEHAAGGMHWSCLCFHRPTNTFRHYDSSPANGNRSVARLLAGAATPLVRSKGSTPGSTVHQPAFEQIAAMPSQQNGYDCGLYLCAAAQAMCGLVQEGLQQAERSTAEIPKYPQQAAGGMSEAAPNGTAGSAAGAAPSSTAEAGGSLKRKFEEQEQADSGLGGKGFEEGEREVLQSITSSSIEQLRQHMLELMEGRAAQQQ